MDGSAVVDSISAHMDVLAKLVNTTVGLAIVSGWAGLQKTEEITILSMKVSRREAFFILATIFISVNFTSAILFLRLADLMQLPGAEPGKVAAAVALHPWAFNPFAYFGPSMLSIIYSSVGYACLIIIWWIGLSSLVLFADPREKFALPVYGIFLVVGLGSMLTINQVFSVLLSKVVPQLPLDDQEGIWISVDPRTVATFSGIFLGGAINFIVMGFTLKRSLERDKSLKELPAAVTDHYENG